MSAAIERPRPRFILSVYSDPDHCEVWERGPSRLMPGMAAETLRFSGSRSQCEAYLSEQAGDYETEDGEIVEYAE